jgi:hypothetical protein
MISLGIVNLNTPLSNDLSTAAQVPGGIEVGVLDLLKQEHVGLVISLGDILLVVILRKYT